MHLRTVGVATHLGNPAQHAAATDQRDDAKASHGVDASESFACRRSELIDTESDRAQRPKRAYTSAVVRRSLQARSAKVESDTRQYCTGPFCKGPGTPTLSRGRDFGTPPPPQRMDKLVLIMTSASCHLQLQDFEFELAP
jgi:hypothetical protein